MKKLVFLGLVLAVVVWAPLVGAVGMGTGGNEGRFPVQKVREERKEMRQERVETRQENREEVRTAFQQKKQEIAGRRADKLSEHCGVLETRLEGIIEKIQKLADARKVEGKDISLVTAALVEAKGYIAKGAETCGQAVDKFNSVPDDKWSVQNSVVSEAKKVSASAREYYVKARQSVSKALQELAKLRNSN